MITGLLAIVSRRNAALGRVFEPVAAFTASLLAMACAAWGFHISVFLVTLAGVIVLIPGLMLTTAMTELSTRHLASGTARFMGAIVLLLGIAFGIAFGAKLGALTLGTVHSTAPVLLPGWTLLLALVTSPLSFVVLLKAEPRDAIWILLAGILALTGAHFGSEALGAELGAFGGAFVTAFASNWYARLTNRPAQITLVSGLLLLVPGSLGLRSLAALLDGETMAGVDTAFQVLLVAVALVSGILIANIVSPRRKLVR